MNFLSLQHSIFYILFRINTTSKAKITTAAAPIAIPVVCFFFVSFCSFFFFSSFCCFCSFVSVVTLVVVVSVVHCVVASFTDVVKTTCFLADMSDFAAFNEVYAKYFTGKPARSCVAVKDLPKGVLCEVETIAVIEEN